MGPLHLMSPGVFSSQRCRHLIHDPESEFRCLPPRIGAAAWAGVPADEAGTALHLLLAPEVRPSCDLPIHRWTMCSSTERLSDIPACIEGQCESGTCIIAGMGSMRRKCKRVQIIRSKILLGGFYDRDSDLKPVTPESEQLATRVYMKHVIYRVIDTSTNEFIVLDSYLRSFQGTVIIKQMARRSVNCGIHSFPEF